MTIADFLLNSSLNLARQRVFLTPLCCLTCWALEYCFFCTVFLDVHLTAVALTVSLLCLIIVVLLVMSNI